MAKRICEICQENVATLPDRERMGRPIKRICSRCHEERLRNDLKYILAYHIKKRSK